MEQRSIIKKKRNRTFGLSTDPELFDRIEKNRGNINRSKYISTFLNKYVPSKHNKTENVQIMNMTADQSFESCDQQSYIVKGDD